MRQATFGRNEASAATGPGHGPVLALWQPDRAHNLGSALRLCACLDVELDVIEPAGFPLDPRRIREAALDYGPLARWRRHADPDSFLALRRRQGRRLVLLSTRAEAPYHRAAFRADDVLLLGNESRGVPDEVHELADLRLRIPMAAGRRSLNVVNAATLALGELLRQSGVLDRLAGGA
ncbi:MAG TPA: TrmH family RNA methyltransferase [Geminicoccaceae bacterium]|nr:TrmH family RNA methyltransferase [Geminicoccus sp.]HMU50349.1 TrmH family RNA methyltransferase [Geminicoccaceae bacterium]